MKARIRNKDGAAVRLYPGTRSCPIMGWLPQGAVIEVWDTDTEKGHYARMSMTAGGVTVLDRLQGDIDERFLKPCYIDVNDLEFIHEVHIDLRPYRLAA